MIVPDWRSAEWTNPQIPVGSRALTVPLDTVEVHTCPTGNTRARDAMESGPRRSMARLRSDDGFERGRVRAPDKQRLFGAI